MSAAATVWMLLSLVTGAVVCAAAVAAADAQRTARRPERWIWMAAIALIVALGVIAPWRQPGQAAHAATAAPAAVSMAGQGVVGRASLADGVARVMQFFAAPADAAMRMVQGTAVRLPVRMHQGVVIAWMVASVLMLLAFAVTWIRMRRRLERWPVRRIDGIAVRVAPAAGPAVIGLMPSEIVVPQWLLARDGDEQRMVVVHELQHVRAHDPWLLVAACLALITLPWHPALWFAFARLRLAVELDCDRRVLHRGVAPAAYGALLIELSALRSALPSAMPAFSCNGSYLERRLVAMTSFTSRFAVPRRIAGGLFAAVALLAACDTKLPTAAEFEGMDGTTVVRTVAPLVKADGDNVRYVVDGKLVRVEEASAIDAAVIATVNIHRASKTNPAEVRITTRAAAEADSARATRGSGLLVDGTKRASTSDGAVTAPVMARKAFTGLLIVDGKLGDASQLDLIPPDRIESVEVLKGQAAASAYNDPRAVNGVIRITTKAKP